MNAFMQQENGLIGSPADIDAVEKKRDAMMIVISDTHGEYEVLEKIVSDFGADADALVFCGDGSCDIATLFQNAWKDKNLRARIPPVVALARGNGDASRYSLGLDIGDDQPVMRDIYVPERIDFTVAGRAVYAVHGHRHSVDYSTETLVATAYTLSSDLVFYGHTHVPSREEVDGTMFLNPGSCSRPRSGSLPSFAIVSFPGSRERYNVEFFSINETIFGGFNFSIYSV